MRIRSFLLVLMFGVCAMASTVPTTWMSYRNDALAFSIEYPAGWDIRAQGSAVAITSGSGAAFGILKGRPGVRIEDAVQAMFKEHPADWQQSPATFAGKRAIKLVGTDRKDAKRKAVHYFVEQDGGYYFVQTLAPKVEWAAFGDLFAKMIQSFQFLQPSTPDVAQP